MCMAIPKVPPKNELPTLVPKKGELPLPVTAKRPDLRGAFEVSVALWAIGCITWLVYKLH